MIKHWSSAGHRKPSPWAGSCPDPHVYFIQSARLTDRILPVNQSLTRNYLPSNILHPIPHLTCTPFFYALNHSTNPQISCLTWWNILIKIASEGTLYLGPKACEQEIPSTAWDKAEEPGGARPLDWRPPPPPYPDPVLRSYRTKPMDGWHLSDICCFGRLSHHLPSSSYSLSSLSHSVSLQHHLLLSPLNPRIFRHFLPLKSQVKISTLFILLSIDR